MENHPIPQDVTGFQFKLIGNMTVKQFAYLAVGVVLAWVCLQFPVYFIIKFPISAFFGILGASLAFLPVEGRPLDAMISHFIKALFSPTQFVYQKTGGRLYFPSHNTPTLKNQQAQTPPQTDKLRAYLQAVPHAQKNKLDDKEANFLASFANLSLNTNTHSAPQPKKLISTPPAQIQNQPKPVDLRPTQDKKNIEESLEDTAGILKKTLEQAKIQEQALRKQSIDSSAT